MKFTNDDVQGILSWMNTGGELELMPKRKEMFLRAQRAYQRLLEYRSDRIVLQHLKADYGEEYSDSKCRRDLALAKMLFGWRTPGSWEFTSGMIIDWSLEMMAQAAKDRDRKGWAQAAMVLYKFSGGDKQHDRPFDPDDLANPVPRSIEVNPMLVGAIEDPQLEAKIFKLLGEKKAKGIDVPGFTMAEDADFTEHPDEPGS